jgi:hypothetical protein
MYIPDISGTSCGVVTPVLPESCSLPYLMETMKCLYSREFRPLFLEKGTQYITCYNTSAWESVVQRSSELNTNLIWNDIIKRWEPTEFDQKFSEDETTNSGYEFRSYNNVYGIDQYS